MIPAKMAESTEMPCEVVNKVSASKLCINCRCRSPTIRVIFRSRHGMIHCKAQGICGAALKNHIKRSTIKMLSRVVSDFSGLNKS